MLYFFKRLALSIAGQSITVPSAIELAANQDAEIVNGDEPTELLVLQGRPINEPVAQHGPFVMNTQTEVHQAFADYHATEFGGWPWHTNDPVHPRDQGRFAKQADGQIETP